MMIEKHLEEMNDLADIMFAMDQNFQDRENEAKSEYQSMRDEIKNKVRFWKVENKDRFVACESCLYSWSHYIKLILGDKNLAVSEINE